MFSLDGVTMAAFRNLKGSHMQNTLSFFVAGSRTKIDHAKKKKKVTHNHGTVSKGHSSRLKKLPMAKALTIGETK